MMKRSTRMKFNKNQLSGLGTPTDWWLLHCIRKTRFHKSCTWVYKLNQLTVALSYWVWHHPVSKLPISSPYFRPEHTGQLMMITPSEENRIAHAFKKVALRFTNSTGWMAKQVDGSTFILIVTSLCIKFHRPCYQIYVRTLSHKLSVSVTHMLRPVSVIRSSVELKKQFVPPSCMF